MAIFLLYNAATALVQDAHATAFQSLSDGNNPNTPSHHIKYGLLDL